MSDPFEVVEANENPDTGQQSRADLSLVDQLLAESASRSPEDLSQKVIRGSVAELIRQRSKLQVQLEDLQEDTLHQQRSFYLKLLEVGDSLDRLLRMLDPANEAAKSVNAIRTQFLQLLERVEICPIEINLGQAFDEKMCEVSDRQERPDLPPKSIIAIERRGYIWGEKVLRPARVSISSNSKGG